MATDPGRPEVVPFKLRRELLERQLWGKLTTKGYGFIQPDGGGQDVFVHISAVEKAAYSGLAEGAKISYELLAGRTGKTSGKSAAGLTRELLAMLGPTS